MRSAIVSGTNNWTQAIATIPRLSKESRIRAVFFGKRVSHGAENEIAVRSFLSLFTLLQSSSIHQRGVDKDIQKAAYKMWQDLSAYWPDPPWLAAET